MRETLNSPEFADLPPSQIVPKLADQGEYIASEASFYRLMRAEGLSTHRGKTQSRQPKPKTTHTATGPNQLWCWDITWLPGPVTGIFFYLYLILDVFSRKVVGWEVHDCERSSLAADLIQKAFWRENLHKIHQQPLILHSDNGSPMKGSALQVKLAELGIEPSYSRPRVSNDNAYAESIFKTTKYRPDFPHQGFTSLESAQRWVDQFVHWYNHEHQHSGLKFVTPVQRHTGEDLVILSRRKQVYEQAKAASPNRWSGNIRNWELADEVHLNPERNQTR